MVWERNAIYCSPTPIPERAKKLKNWWRNEGKKRRNNVSTQMSFLGAVTTMPNSGSYPVTPVASQLYSSTPVAQHLLRSRLRRYLSVKYDPWSMLYLFVTTPRRSPCLDVSSPWTRYILYLVAFSLDLIYFIWSWLYFHRTWPSPNSSRPLSANRLFTCHRKYSTLVLT